MGAEYVWRAIITFRTMHVERIHLGPRGVMAGDVERVEIVPIAFDLRAFGDGETHIGEDRGDLFGDLADRVDGALCAGAGWQGDVEPFVAQAGI